MTDQILLARLRPVLTRMRRRRMLIGGTLGWGASALVVSAFLLTELWHIPADRYASLRFGLLAGGLLAGILGAAIGWHLVLDAAAVARQLEKHYPDLEGRLTT